MCVPREWCTNNKFFSDPWYPWIGLDPVLQPAATCSAKISRAYTDPQEVILEIQHLFGDGVPKCSPRMELMNGREAVHLVATIA